VADLGARAEAFTDFIVSKALDDDGIVLSVLKSDELRAWRNEDYRGYEVWDYIADDPAGYENYEDAIMATGWWIVSQVMRYVAEGEPEDAYRHAERSVRAILAISREGDKYETGYLPKPHGGLANASKSRCISSDQYEHALFGLWHFRSICADAALRAEIEAAIVKWADYFRRHDFCYRYFERMTITPEIAVHGLGLFLPLMVMAEEITGDGGYRDAMDERLIPVLRENLVYGETSSGTGPNPTALIAVGLVHLWNRGILREEAAKDILWFWRDAQKFLSADGLTYVHAGVTDDAPVKPGYVGAEEDDPLNYTLGRYRSNVKSSVSVKLSLVAPMVHAVAPDCGALEVGRRVLDVFQSPEEFLLYIDRDGRQIPQSWAYCRLLLLNCGVCEWLWAHYLMTYPDLVERL